jgi:hypothetical protein
MAFDADPEAAVQIAGQLMLDDGHRACGVPELRYQF